MKKTIVIFAYVFVTGACMAMADTTPPVYGRPTLYGEYEVSASDTARAAKLYGDMPRAAAAIRASEPGKAAAKRPVKPKKALAKKGKKKAVPARTAAADKKVSETQTPKILPPTEIPVQHNVVVKPRPASPSPEAVAIAAAAESRFDVDSYCTRRGPYVRGKMPDGFILMPGRPDMMSCVDK